MLAKLLHLDVHEQIECAQTLASRFYTDPAILDLEKTVQRGLRSSTCDRGRYSVKRENGVHHFHMFLGEFLARS